MIKVDEIRDFISGNYQEATLVIKSSKDKIKIDLKLTENTDNYKKDNIYNTSLEELIKNPRELLEYLFDNYISNNMILGTYYFTDIPHHKDKICFEITGSKKLSIAIDRNILFLLPDKFINRIEQRKRECMLDCINDLDTKVFTINNLNKNNSYLYRSFTGGVYGDYFIYNALVIKDKNGMSIIPKKEINLIKKILEILIEKDNIDLDYLIKVKNKIDLELSNLNDNSIDKDILSNIDAKLSSNGFVKKYLEIKSNKKITFNIYDVETLKLFSEFLSDYLIKFEDKLTKEQLIIK